MIQECFLSEYYTTGLLTYQEAENLKSIFAFLFVFAKSTSGISINKEAAWLFLDNTCTALSQQDWDGLLLTTSPVIIHYSGRASTSMQVH